MRLTSPAFVAGTAIPRTYTCDGRDLPPPLRWSGIPPSARELVLVMRDPDAPGGNFVHWAVAGIPPTASGLPAKGVVEGRNSFGTVGYRGPCPPAGDKAHHYVLTLSALGGRSGLGAGFSADQLHTAAVGLATLVGTYRRR
jgi:Raf kinase inhibitor-like YbhB/YbcL family protein